MWILLLFLSAAVHTLASKERVSLQDLPGEEKDILIELVKRLGQGNDPDQLGWKDTAQCEAKPNKSVIIKKKESLANGAQFIKLYKDIETNEACSDQCCKNMSCDMALFENKGDHYCYLFRCEGNCIYSHHSNYIKNDIIRHSPQAPSPGDGSEQDLIDLDPGSDVSNNDRKDDSLKTVPAATPPISTTSATYIRAHSVGLEGPYCELNVHCEDPEAVCNYHKCRCRDGYYKKGPICRQVCPPSNFECLELGTLGRGPQCVTEMQVCDSVMQCADGSDEFNCPDSGAPPIRTWQQQQQPLQPQAEPVPQQDSQSSRPQQQPFSQSQQGYVNPSNGVSQTGDQGSPQGYLGQGQNVGQVDPQQYPAYNPQQQVESQQSQTQQIQNSGQSVSGPQQAVPQALPPNSNIGFSSDNSGYIPNDAMNSGALSRQPASANQPQAVGNQQTFQNAKVPAQPPLMHQQPFQNPPAQQPGNTRQQFPQSSQQTFEKSLPKQSGSKSSSQLFEKLNPQQTYEESQNLYNGQESKQPYKISAPQGYQPGGSQQYPPSQGQQPVQSAPDSRRLPSSAQSLPEQELPRQKLIYSESGAVKSSSNVQNQQAVPAHQDSEQQALAQPHPSPQAVKPTAGHLVQPKPSAKAVAVAEAHPQNLHPTDPSLEMIDSHKPYIVPVHSKPQDSPGPIYRPPLAKDIPEQPHPHSAYDVRIGEPSLPHRKPDMEQKSFLNPTELSDLDVQEPASHFLNGFGDQYLPQQTFGKQYNPYSRYPNAYQQNTGIQGNGYPGLSEQLYPGAQGQRVYPQQGYVDFGYPASQFEFGEFDPPYPESESYPGSHDLPDYRPGSRLGGYEGSYKGYGVLGKGEKPTEKDDALINENPKQESSDEDDKAPQPPKPKPTADKDSIDKSADTDADTNKPSDNTDVIDDSSSNKVPHSKSDTDSQNETKDSSDNNAPAKSDATDTAGNSDSVSLSKEGAGKGDSSSKFNQQAEKGMEKESEVDELLKSQDEFISRQRVNMHTLPTSMQGPIIALSLGLAFTVILLIFVACRLRTVRHRLRKGRPLHSNEADYLINGMYL